MRLGQLARKLAVRPSQIVDYLSTHKIYLEEGSNAKLNDEDVDRIVLHFAPDRLKEIVEDIKTEEAENIAPSIVTEEPEKEDSKPEIAESETGIKLEKPEVIKAPKVELSGLKVLGKIELPQSKKKDQPAPTTEETKIEPQEQGRQRPESRKPQTKSKREVQQPWRNPIALQREREAREAEERKREAAEREKERRKEHYLKRVKVGQPTKPARIIDEPIELHITQKSADRPRGLWGRFMKWLNG